LNNSMTGQVLFYILISALLLVFSIVLKVTPVDTISFAFTLTYLLGSLESVLLMIPNLMRAGVASRNLEQLRTELEDSIVPVHSHSRNYDFKSFFQHIQICALEFYYGDRYSSFGIGPIDFEIHAGEVVFIYGGNGSGKTTFIYSLLGLLYPTTGMIKINNTAVNETNYPAYRALFSVVFSDYYLFNEIITPERIDPEKADYYLKVFELSDKVTLENNQYSTVDLSAGQKKRLVLSSVLLEDKRILVLDEWAADQDPYFREKFYREIIPSLKNNGMTVIAITHDDKYYHCADRLFKMEDGKMVPKSVNVYDRITQL
jgi:putative pyoverdin transport system ATP-binding/permease protein